jgi:hypothetical protein
MALRYGGAHQRKRALERPHMYGKPCARCGKPLVAPIELDHDDHDPTKYLGWSHARCNRAARNRLEAARARARYQSPAAARGGPEPTLVRPDGLPPRQHARAW